MNRMLATFAFVVIVLSWFGSTAIGPAAPPKKPTGDDAVLQWNEIALQAVVEDHSGTFGPPAQSGPTRGSRALAIVHIAIYDAVNAIDGSHEPYLRVGLGPHITKKASVDAAVAQAAHDTLAALYPSQQSVFARELRLALNRVPAKRGRNHGVTVGAQAAANILLLRDNDGAAQGDEFIYPESTEMPGEHVPDPINPGQGLLTPGWGKVDTFSSIDVTDLDVRTLPPPELTDQAYTDDFLDVFFLGGDGIITPTLRSREETEIGLFWAYDGARGIGVPPRLYNQIARTIAKQKKNTLVQNARLFALVNIAMADAGIAAWDSKYFYNLWRPVVAIRRADEDGNPDTDKVADWTPLGAPASNQSGNDFTPPFPAYPSGHATFGAAMFRTLNNFYDTDNIAFQFQSDELNGRTTDSSGNHRRSVIRRFNSLSEAMIENGRSRIYLGIHWQFDADSGIAQGITVADHAFDELLRPVP